MATTTTAAPAASASRASKAQERTQPRLKQKYQTEIAAQLKKDFGFTNVHQVPGLVKIVVNTGVGEAARSAADDVEEVRWHVRIHGKVLAL